MCIRDSTGRDRGTGHTEELAHTIGNRYRLPMEPAIARDDDQREPIFIVTSGYVSDGDALCPGGTGNGIEGLALGLSLIHI